MFSGILNITRGMQQVFQGLNPNLFFKNSYIPSTIIEWNKLDQDIRNAESYTLFLESTY